MGRGGLARHQLHWNGVYPGALIICLSVFDGEQIVRRDQKQDSSQDYLIR
jgi:hypothetical protein